MVYKIIEERDVESSCKEAIVNKRKFEKMILMQTTSKVNEKNSRTNLVKNSPFRLIIQVANVYSYGEKNV